MGDLVRYARVFTILGLVLAGALVGVRDTIHWALSPGQHVGTADDRHLRLSVEESQNSEYHDQPYKGRKFQAQYEKL
jgi:hypothetical protein